MIPFQKKKIGSKQALAEIARLRNEVAETQALADAYQIEIQDLKSALELGDQDARGPLEAAQKGFEIAKQKLVDKSDALLALERTHQTALAAEAAEKEAKAWAEVDDLESKIIAQFKVVDSHAEKLMDAFREGHSLIARALAVVPKTDGTALDTAPTADSKLITYLRLKLRKEASRDKRGVCQTGPQNSFLHGFVAWFELNSEIPDVVDSVKEAVGWMQRMNPGRRRVPKLVNPEPQAEAQ